MNKIKKTNPDKKKQYKQFGISLGISFGVLLIGFLAYILLFNGAKAALKDIEKGKAYFTEGKYDLAAAAYKSAVNNDPKNATALLGLATSYDELGKDDEAITLMLKAIDDAPGNDNFYKFIIQNYVKNNKIDKALEFINNIKHPPILYKLKDIRPTNLKFSPNPGSYDKYISVTISTDAGCTIYYTTDGSLPNLNSQKYTSPIKVDKDKLNLRAFAVNADNIISDESSVIYNIYNDNQKYVFYDTKIEAIVRSILNRPTGDILYKDIIKVTRLSNFDSAGKPIEGYIRKLDDLLAMKSLTELVLNNEPVLTGFGVFSSLTALKNVTLNGCGIDDNELKDICAATWITTLMVDKNQISDLTQLTQLSQLQNFSASDNRIASVEAFGVLTGIRQLNLSKNSLTNIDSLSKLTAVTSLDISGNSISDFNTLLSLKAVEDLKLSSNKIADLSGISVLSGLKNLYIAENLITDIAPLSQVRSLSILDLSKNNIKNLDPISKLSLTQLILSNCGINDLMPLAGLNTLKYLDVKNDTLSTSICPYINDITDINALSVLNNLEVVKLSLNPNLISIKKLQYCPNLKSVYVIGCDNITANDLSGTNIQIYLS